MNINYNGTYRGFIIIYNKDGVLMARKDNATCCQVIRDHVVENVDKIIFGFPDDWLPNEFRNDEFLKWWCQKVSGWFTEVKYTGVGKAEDLQTDCARVNTQNGYTNGRYKDVPINKGDLITNDKWRMFEIIADHNKKNFAIFNYSAFVLIRYLFATHYQQIVKNYLNYRYYLTDVDKIKHPDDLDEFKLFQLAHYGDVFREYGNKDSGNHIAGYHSTYGMIPFFTSTISQSHTLGVDHRPYKLISLEQTKVYLETNPSLNMVFNRSVVNKITVSELEKLLEQRKIYKAYEAIN